MTPAGVVFLKQAQQLGLDKLTLIHSYGFVRPATWSSPATRRSLLLSLKFPVGDQLPDSDPLKAEDRGCRQLQERFKRTPKPLRRPVLRCLYLTKTAIDKVGGDVSKVREGWGDPRLAGVGGVFNFSPDRHSGLSKNDLVLINCRDGRLPSRRLRVKRSPALEECHGTLA